MLPTTPPYSFTLASVSRPFALLAPTTVKDRARPMRRVAEYSGLSHSLGAQLVRLLAQPARLAVGGL